ncbi:MAG: DUF4127 family protein [Veillonellales bacterium]
MLNRSAKYCIFTFLVMLAAAILLGHYKTISYPPVSLKTPQYQYRIVLLPLDSRPPCTQFVHQLAEIAGIEVISPPAELLDHYKTPADKQQLLNWLYQQSEHADAAIISIDMLTHGSLLASRLSQGTPADSQNALDMLNVIHQHNPAIKLYAFNIIPRLLLADSKENEMFKKNMLTYSVLKDQFRTFENPADLQKLTELEKQLPPAMIDHYRTMYAQNNAVNEKLADLVETGILSGLVIGQDDGQPFGLPNVNKQKLQRYLANKPSIADKVQITRGTDEVALTLLGQIAMKHASSSPRIFVAYSDEDAPRIVMPFMPHSVGTTVQEKIQILGGTIVSQPDEADFILYVHIGTQKNSKNKPFEVQQVQSFIQQGYNVALVDLAENFYASETLLPELMQANADITKLSAYAGWNTTSNSVGTAVTQAALFTASVRNEQDIQELLQTYHSNLVFLTGRLLDDWFFEKDVQPYVNKRLKWLRIDPYNLGPHYQYVDTIIKKLMSNRGDQLLKNHLANHPLQLNSSQGSYSIVITSLKVKTLLPWERTFEILVEPSIDLGYADQAAD